MSQRDNVKLPYQELTLTAVVVFQVTMGHFLHQDLVKQLRAVQLEDMIQLDTLSNLTLELTQGQLVQT
jgi:uncharacterized protein (DUF2062 family)